MKMCMNSAESSESQPIVVDFLDNNLVCLKKIKGKLGMTFAPGKQEEFSLARGYQITRDIDKDLHRLEVEYNAHILVTLNQDFELEQMKIGNIAAKAAEHHIQSLKFSIVDMQAPKAQEKESFHNFVKQIVQQLKDGKNVIIHCKEGKGRTGMLAACCLVELGLEPKRAVNTVRRTRPGTIQTWVQESYINKFKQ